MNKIQKQITGKTSNLVFYSDMWILESFNDEGIKTVHRGTQKNYYNMAYGQDFLLVYLSTFCLH